MSVLVATGMWADKPSRFAGGAVLELSAEAFLTAQCANHRGPFAAQAIVDIMSDSSRPPGADADPIPEVEGRGDS